MKKIITSIFLCCLTATLFGQSNTYFHDRIDTTIYATTTGTNTYIGTNTDPNFNVAKYQKGLLVSTFIVHGNTGACTYQLVTKTGTLSSVAIKKQGGSALSSGDIPDSSAVFLLYYGSFWRLVGMYSSSTSFWSLTGNSGTSAGTNFLGTTDAQDVVFKRNNSEVMRLYSSNKYVGIGTSTPSTILDVTGGGGIQCKALNGDVAMELRDHNGSGVLYVWDQSRIDILNAGTQVSNFTQGKLIINGGGDLTAHGVLDCRGDMESRYTGAAATVGNQIINSSYHFWVGSHWNGASGIDNSFFMFDSTTSTTTQALIWGTGDAFPSGTERMRLTGTGILSIGSATPSASAKLQVSSTTQGFLLPVMTGAQGEAISSPATGLLIYATSAGGGDIISAGWWGWNGSNWVKLN